MRHAWQLLQSCRPPDTVTSVPRRTRRRCPWRLPISTAMPDTEEPQ